MRTTAVIFFLGVSTNVVKMDRNFSPTSNTVNKKYVISMATSGANHSSTLNSHLEGFVSNSLGLSFILMIIVSSIICLAALLLRSPVITGRPKVRCLPRHQVDTLRPHASLVTFRPYNVMAFTLFGDAPRYTEGMIHNARLLAIHFPGWTARVYIDATTVPASIVRTLRTFPHVELVSVGRKGDMCSKLWRFHPALGDPLTPAERRPAIVLCRDCDSRCDARDAACVRDWLDDPEGRDFHLIRDHIRHTKTARPILAGLWGCKGRWLCTQGEPIRAAFSRHGLNPSTTGYAADELFLQDFVYPIVYDDCFISVPDASWVLPGERLGKLLPPSRPSHRFMGAVVNAYEQ